jgi:hypothetical protein
VFFIWGRKKEKKKKKKEKKKKRKKAMMLSKEPIELKLNHRRCDLNRHTILRKNNRFRL